MSMLFQKLCKPAQSSWIDACMRKLAIIKRTAEFWDLVAAIFEFEGKD